MFLAIDIGNTNITLGLFDGEKLGPSWRYASGRYGLPDEFGASMIGFLKVAGCPARAVTAVAIASVVPSLTESVTAAVVRYLNCRPLVVDGAAATGLRILYDDPAQVGADRIVDAVAGYRIYGGPVCIIDFGTATTFDAVTGDGEYLGGAIVPGIVTAADALFERTAKLPRVSLARPPSVIGKNIAHSLQSGLLYGYIGLVEGLVARFRAEMGSSMKVIATGGLAAIIAKETAVISVVAPWLTLEGLRIVYLLNSGDE
ncbi:MAG TPA: type III pantothenate kinase [Acidobacteriota bacterium]|nr:type III pantothenate kinase [Acidobacteriota bacterium]